MGVAPLRTSLTMLVLKPMALMAMMIRNFERSLSGAVTAGLVYHLLQDEGLGVMKEAVGLNRSSVVLCISTEGDTDWENYRHVVWDGWYRSPM